MIDAHTHLNDLRLLPDIDALLGRMKQQRVYGALVVGYDLPSSREAINLARSYPCLRAAIGVHPHESKTLDEETMASMRELACCPEVVAYGEIGLDFYYDHSPRDIQRDAFRRQLSLAAEVNLPAVIHERDAAEEVMTILGEEGGWALGGEWHCCSVSPDLAVEISRFLYLGIAGWITFPKAENIRELVRAAPLERMLLETDAPYITPVPYRGKTNEPSFLRFTAEALASERGVSLETVEKITEENTLCAFPKWREVQVMEE